MIILLFIKRYGIKWNNSESVKDRKIYNRAKNRREELDKFEKNVNNSQINKDNIGKKMMEKMGWKEGKGLGKSEIGIIEPVRIIKYEIKYKL